MSKQELAADYCNRVNELLNDCSETEKIAHKDDRAKLYHHNQIRIDRVLRNYDHKLKEL